MKAKERYSRLAPFPIEQQIQLALAAISFFGYKDHAAKRAAVGKPPPQEGMLEPFSGSDFERYVERIGLLPEAGRYMFRLRDLLVRLERANLLIPAGETRNLLMGRLYHFMREFTALEHGGYAWLAPVLGAEFVHHYFQGGVVQITGRLDSGDLHAGTGLVVSRRWVVTCAHVVTEMSVDEEQHFAGQRLHVVRALAHKSVDVGVIETDCDMPVVPGLAFRAPTIAETIFTLGYPRVPLTRRPALIMQSGQVTSQTQKLINGQDIFLYSAIARPGNSGGPIVSESGHVVGLVTQQLEEQRAAPHSSPFHAGIDAMTTARAFEELVPGNLLPIETYE
jgi:Trypsin-like peptidase domain